MKLRDLIREMLKVVPSSYLASLEFFTEILNSPYRDVWARNANPASNYAHSYLLNKPDLRNEQAEDTMASMCQELLNKGKELLYKFIVFLIKSYCRNSKEKKVEIRGLKIALRSIGISEFDEMEKYAKDTPLIESIINIDSWPNIANAIDRIQKSSSIAESEIDFQNIGNSCRDLIISLAKIVYDPSVHGNKNEEGKNIGKTDAIGMLTNYFAFRLSGADNDEFRSYAKATNKIANKLTHNRNATKKDMLLTVSATIALVNLVMILENVY